MSRMTTEPLTFKKTSLCIGINIFTRTKNQTVLNQKNQKRTKFHEYMRGFYISETKKEKKTKPGPRTESKTKWIIQNIKI